MSELKTGRVEVREVEVTEREKTKIMHELVLDGHVLGQSKSQADALVHAYAIERSLEAATPQTQLGRTLRRALQAEEAAEKFQQELMGLQDYLEQVVSETASAYPEAAI